MHRLFTILVLLLAVGFASLHAEFKTQQVDDQHLMDEMTDRSSIVDVNGAMHIAYGKEHLYYATNKSGNWVIETVDSLNNVGSYASLALDSAGNVHIAYRGYGLRYATNKSGSWVIELVDSPDWESGYSTSIAIDSNDKMHISYHNIPIPYLSLLVHLRYATNKSGIWVIETLDNSEESGQGSSITLDSNDKVHISYDSNTNKLLKYVTNKSGIWVIETITTHGGGRDSSIALDSSGNVHISYHGSGLGYATNMGGSWTSEILATSIYTGFYTSLALDSNGKVHISYCDSNEKILKYIHNKSGDWINEEVESIIGIKRFSSISLDSNDMVHISYYDSVNNALMYATNATVTVPLFGPLGALLLIALFGFTAIRKIDKV